MIKAKTYIARIKGVSPYSASRYHGTPKKDDETPDAYEERTWEEKAYYVNDEVCIPAQAFKQAISSAAKYGKKKIAGQGNSTYSKKFSGGLIVAEDLMTGVSRSQVKKNQQFCHANGQRGPGPRVMRIFPSVVGWEGDLKLIVLDTKNITPEVLTEHLEMAGMFVGIGQFRPENEGSCGRFTVLSLKEVE